MTLVESAVTTPAATVVRPGLGQRGAWWLSDTRAMTWRYAVAYIRSPEGLVFSLIQPVMFVFLFRYVFGGAIRTPPGINYVNYLLPGIILQTAAFGSIGTAIGLSLDLTAGLIDRFRSLPMARSAVLVGRIAADTLRNVLVIALMIGVGYVVGFRFSNGIGAAVLVVVLALAIGVGFSFVSATIGLTLKQPEAVQSFGLIWMFPLIFASSAFVPPQFMPSWLRVFADNQPVTKFVDALRDLSLGPVTGRSAATDVWVAIAWLVVIVVVFMPLAVRAYRKAT